MLSLGTVHYWKAESALIKRQQVLEGAYAARPERFVKGPPTVSALPQAIWINRPISLMELAAEHSKAHYFLTDSVSMLLTHYSPAFPGGNLEKPVVPFPLKAGEYGVYVAVIEDIALDDYVRMMHIAGRRMDRYTKVDP